MTNKTDDNRNIYKQCRNRVVTVIREEQRHFYHLKIDEVKSNPKKMWEMLGELITDKKRKQIERIEVKGIVYESTSTISEEINKYFVESVKEVVNTIDTQHLLPVTIERNHLNTLNFFHLINMEQLQEIVFGLPTKASPDDVCVDFLKNTFQNIKSPLLHLINTSLEVGRVPSLLKVSNIIPIQKVRGAIKAEDFRPINVLPTIDKILERVVYDQLIKFVTESNILIENQSGFRKYHSCESAMQHILYEWKHLLDDDYMVGTVFLDLKRAFEIVDRTKLIRKLIDYGIGDLALAWLVDYLDHRMQVTRVNGQCSAEIGNDFGVPQGSTLGPLLFLIYINDINLAVKKCSLHLFADDTLMYYYSKDLDRLIDAVNLDLSYLQGWFNSNSLRLNATKSKFMIIGNKGLHGSGIVENIQVKVGNEVIEMVREHKYLGFVLDHTLSFKNHLEYIIDKITKSVNIMSRVASALSQWAKITVYNTLVLPHFIFSAPIMYLANKNELNRLQRLQNRAMRIILKERRDTSIKSMLRRLEWLPVDKYIIYLNMILIYKIQNSLTPAYLTNKLKNHISVHSHDTRNRDHYYITTKNKKSTENSLYHKGLIEFNKLPHQIKSSPNLNQFKTKLRHKLMGE